MMQTLPTASVLQHTSVAHLIANVAMLAIVGPRVWRVLGAWRFAVLFLLAGMLANVSAAALIERPVIGASSAVAGVMAAHLVLFPSSRYAPFIGLWIALQVVFASVGLDFAGIAWIAHLIGAAVGATFALLVRFARRDRAQTATL